MANFCTKCGNKLEDNTCTHCTNSASVSINQNYMKELFNFMGEFFKKPVNTTLSSSFIDMKKAFILFSFNILSLFIFISLMADSFTNRIIEMNEFIAMLFYEMVDYYSINYLSVFITVVLWVAILLGIFIGSIYLFSLIFKDTLNYKELFLKVSIASIGMSSALLISAFMMYISIPLAFIILLLGTILFAVLNVLAVDHTSEMGIEKSLYLTPLAMVIPITIFIIASF